MPDTAGDIRGLMLLMLMLFLAFSLSQALITKETKVVHVQGHTCIETKGFVRSISCDWNNGVQK